MHLQKNNWIFGSETGDDLFFLEITLAYGFQKKKKSSPIWLPKIQLFRCRSSIPPKKRSRTEFERPVFYQLLLIALTVTHPEARGPAVTPQRPGFGPRSASITFILSKTISLLFNSMLKH